MSTPNRTSDSADERRERMSQATLSMFDGVVASWNLKTFEGIPDARVGEIGECAIRSARGHAKSAVASLPASPKTYNRWTQRAMETRSTTRQLHLG